MIVLLLFVLLSSSFAFGAACCGGGGPKSFIVLRDLQDYELGVATSFRDVFGLYDNEGNIQNSDRNQNYTLSLGAALRISAELEVFSILPFSHQVEALGDQENRDTGIGDILVGGRYNVFRNVLRSDWYPNVTVLAGLRLPTGASEPVTIGSGIWEPSIGLEFSKNLRPFLLSATASYSYRFSSQVPNTLGTGDLTVKEGNRFEIVAAAKLSVARNLNVGLGFGHQWDGATRIEGQRAENTEARLANGFVSASYFLNRYWAVSGNYEQAIELSGFGKNQQAARVLTLSTTYGFY